MAARGRAGRGSYRFQVEGDDYEGGGDAHMHAQRGGRSPGGSPGIGGTPNNSGGSSFKTEQAMVGRYKALLRESGLISELR